eukprot:UN21471
MPMRTRMRNGIRMEITTLEITNGGPAVENAENGYSKIGGEAGQEHI